MIECECVTVGDPSFSRVTVLVKLKRSVHNHGVQRVSRPITGNSVRLLYEFCTAGQQADHEASTPWPVLHGPACYVQPCYSYRPAGTGLQLQLQQLQLQLQPCFCATITFTSLCMHMGDTGLVLHLAGMGTGGGPRR